MKTLLKSLLALSLLLLATSAFAKTEDNVKIVAGNWENSMGTSGSGPCVLVLPDNILVINLSVYVADTDLSNAKDMYLRYNFNGTLMGVTPQITSADFTPVNENGHDIYRATFTFVVDVSENCLNQPQGVPFDFQYQYKLIAMDTPGSNPTTYPVHNYPTLWPTNIFDELLEPNYQPIYTGFKQICCPTLTQLRSPDAGSDLLQSPTTMQADISTDEVGQDVSLGMSAFAEKVDLQVFPNPFRDEINVQTPVLADTQLEFVLRDASGKRVYNYREAVIENGHFQGVIPTAALPAGVYYLQLRSKRFTQTHKIIKFE